MNDTRESDQEYNRLECLKLAQKVEGDYTVASKVIIRAAEYATFVCGQEIPGLATFAVEFGFGAEDEEDEDELEAELDDVNEFDFGAALGALKEGDRVTRSGWNGKDMFLFLVDGSTFKVNRKPLSNIYSEGTEINYHAHIDMKTVDGSIVPWLASQTDLLAEDWYIV